MCGGDTPKQRPSAHDIALAQKAGRDDERFVEAFLPLEVFEIEQFRDPVVQKINRDIVAGRVNADAAQQERAAHMQAMRAAQASGSDLTSEANQAALRDNTLAAASASSRGAVEADRMARNIHDAEGLSIIRTGQDINRGNTESLGALARQENFKASSRLRARQLENASRAEALGKVASAAVIGGADAFKRARDPNTRDSDLSLGARAMRNVFQAMPTIGGSATSTPQSSLRPTNGQFGNI